jgi:sugar phosphate isomerase/epimerase
VVARKPDSTVRLAGKAPATPEGLERAHARGFHAIELYVERTHLDDLDATIQAVEAAPVDPVSVHTPHVTLDAAEWLSRADRLAVALDATLVVHSAHEPLTRIPQLEALEFDAPYAYENQAGVSEWHLRNAVLDRGHDLVLDTAHLFIGEEAYLDSLERLLVERGDQIPLVHFCDSTLTRDGLAFEEGSLPLDATIAVLDEHFEGGLVLEVMPADQAAARRYYEAVRA